MRAKWRFLWRPDPGLLLTLAICTLAVWSFLLRPGLPQGADMTLHTHRTAEYIRLREAGVLIPRWSPNLYYGYGYPIFNYYAPASYALSGLLSGGDAVSGVRALLVVSILGAGAGMYQLARRLAGSRAGVVAGIVYVYSPYMVLIEPHFRGAMPELMALALLPWLFLAFYGLLTRHRPLDFVFATLTFALVLLTHNLMALVSGVMLVAWLLWEWLFGARQNRPWQLVGLALGLGIGLAMYFWLPVLLERDAVRLNNLLIYDFRKHFRPFGELFAFSPVLDLGAANPPYLYNLGPATWLLALAGLGWIIRRANQAYQDKALKPLAHTRTLLFFAAAAIVLIALMCESFAFVWDAVPLMNFLQFPWRLLGPAAFCLAILAGVSTRWLNVWPKGRVVGLAMLVALPVVLAFPVLMPPEWPQDFGPTDANSIIQYELERGIVGTTATDDFRPALVHIPPEPDEHLLASYAGEGPIDKVNRFAVPPGVTVEIIRHTPVEDVVRYNAPESFNLVFNTFYWPGWQMTVDGDPVEIVVPEPYGLIMALVPAGEHEARVFLADTPPRAVGQGISLISALGLIVIFGALVRHSDLPPSRRTWISGQKLTAEFVGDAEGKTKDRAQAWQQGIGHILHWFSRLFLWQSLRTLRALRLEKYAPDPEYTPPGENADRLAGQDVFAVALGGIVIVVLAGLLLSRPGVVWLRSAPGTAEIAQTQHFRTLDDDISFLGFDLSGQETQPGGTFEVVVYWARTRPIERDYRSFVHLRAEDGPLWGQADKISPADYPTTLWPDDRYIRDAYRVEVHPDTPPGEYALWAGLWTCEGVPEDECGPDNRLRVYEPGGEIEGDSVQLSVLVTVRAE